MSTSSRGRRAIAELVPEPQGVTRAAFVAFQLAVVATALVVFAAAQAWALGAFDLGARETVLAGLGVMAILGLAVVRPEAAVGLGVALLAVVRVEPAPADAVFAILMGLAFVTGRFAIGRIPPLVVWHSGAYLALNLFSLVEVIALGRAVQFFAVTLYLVLFSFWFAT